MKTWYLNILAILIGGAFGSMLRYGVNIYGTFTVFPIGTLLVNLSASFIIGVLTGVVIHFTLPEWLRLGAGVGFCGSLSTMSAPAVDTTVLIHYGTFYDPVLYLSLSLFGGVSFGFLGFIIGTEIGKKKQIFKS